MEKKFFEIKIFCDIINVLTVTFGNEMHHCCIKTLISSKKKKNTLLTKHLNGIVDRLIAQMYLNGTVDSSLDQKCSVMPMYTRFQNHISVSKVFGFPK